MLCHEVAHHIDAIERNQPIDVWPESYIEAIRTEFCTDRIARELHKELFGDMGLHFQNAYRSINAQKMLARHTDMVFPGFIRDRKWAWTGGLPKIVQYRIS